MITLDTLSIITLLGIIASGIYNVMQWQQLRHIKKQTFKPIYNGLIGLFNDVKNKGTYCYTRQSLLFHKDSPYKDIEVLRWNFYEFITETIAHFQSLREHIVPILKTIEPSEDRVFKEADFAVTQDEKEARKKISENWKIEQEIRRTRLTQELEELRTTRGSNKKDGE